MCEYYKSIQKRSFGSPVSGLGRSSSWMAPFFSMILREGILDLSQVMRTFLRPMVFAFGRASFSRIEPYPFFRSEGRMA